MSVNAVDTPRSTVPPSKSVHERIMQNFERGIIGQAEMCSLLVDAVIRGASSRAEVLAACDNDPAVLSHLLSCGH